MKLLEDIFTSILSSIIIAIAAWLYAKHNRKQIVVILNRLMGTGIEYIYKNDEEATDDMIKYVRRSDTVKILSMRAFRLLNDRSALKFLLRQDNPVKEVQVLLANPDSEAVAARAEEFIHIDPSYTPDRYVEDIRWSGKQVAMNQRNKKLILRVHQEPAFIRLLITDDYLFLSFFLKDTHGDNSRVFLVNRFSPLYEAFCRYHDWVWKNRSEALVVTSIPASTGNAEKYDSPPQG